MLAKLFFTNRREVFMDMERVVSFDPQKVWTEEVNGV